LGEPLRRFYRLASGYPLHHLHRLPLRVGGSVVPLLSLSQKRPLLRAKSIKNMEKQQLWRITLDTNPEDCNLQCVMCEEHSPHSTFIDELHQKTGTRRRRMPIELVEKIFAEAKTLGVREIIPSTMGEPLLYKDFDRILELCQTHQIKCNLTTNGTFPKRSAVEWAALIVPVTSDVKISWNGATKATSEAIMLDIDFDKALQNVRDFIRVRDEYYSATNYYCRVTFQLTFMRNNMHELADIIQLAASLGVDRVKGHQLWAHFDQIQTLSFRQNRQTIAEWNHYVAQAHAAADKYRLPNGEKVLLEQITPLQDSETQTVPEQYTCPFLQKELWVSPSGIISPCCAPDHLRQSLGYFGNANNQTLAQTMSSLLYQDLAENYKAIPLCQSCNMRKP
jgi:MoaA/NifB/PqqE/SkfB family radical SAM enzyme